MPKVLLADALDADSEARLDAGATVVRAHGGDEATLCRLIADCDGLVARTYTPVTRAVLAAGRRLKVVGVAGVGVDHVVVAAARELGIAVLNTPAAATDAVADLTLALLLQLLRPIPRLANDYRHGWFHRARARPHGVELHTLTVGIVGMGRIGSAVGRRCAAGCGARVLYNDTAAVGPFDFAATSADKATIWTQCDVVTLHVPLTEETRGLVGRDVLAQMKPTAYLLNTARGAVVETAALTAALEEGRLAGVALDVTSPEPLPVDHPLFRCPRCILTPHAAARTQAGQRRMYAIVDDVLAALRATS